MSPVTQGILLVAGLLAGMFFLLEIGRRFGELRLAKDGDGAKADLGAIDGAVFGLMGLLIAFTFSGAASRFDARRTMVIEEANCIGTAWLRLDLLNTAAQPALREKFRNYSAARLAAFQKVPDLQAATTELNRAATLQQEIWNLAVAACRDPGTTQAPLLLLPALNEMFDAATMRTTTALLHPPLIIYMMLVFLVLASSLLAGYNLGVGKVRHWVHAVAFILAIVLAVYVILDFEFPRLGLIRIHEIDQVFIDLIQTMKP